MEDRPMRSLVQSSRRRKTMKAVRIRHRRRSDRVFDPLQSDDDDEQIVEIGGGRPEDDPVKG